MKLNLLLVITNKYRLVARIQKLTIYNRQSIQTNKKNYTSAIQLQIEDPIKTRPL